MPYTPVSCGTGHWFRDTRSMPYTHWGCEFQSERAPAWRENAFWSRVLGWQIDRDEQMNRQDTKEPEQMPRTNWRLNDWKEDYSLEFSKEIAILSRNSWICETVDETEHKEEVDRDESRTGHWKHAEPRFRGTRTILYTHWGGECQN